VVEYRGSWEAGHDDDPVLDEVGVYNVYSVLDVSHSTPLSSLRSF
jgi:hypothetical protein